MRVRVACVCFLMLRCFEPQTMAQVTLHIEFRNGRVWLRAHDVEVRTILAEWSRLGGAQIVNHRHVSGEPVTLELQGVPEREALAIVLRDMAGYILVPKSAALAGDSIVRGVLVLPTSAAPTPPVAPASESGRAPRPTIPPDLTGPLADALRIEMAREEASAPDPPAPDPPSTGN